MTEELKRENKWKDNHQHYLEYEKKLKMTDECYSDSIPHKFIANNKNFLCFI
jgi:hypothetical protein